MRPIGVMLKTIELSKKGTARKIFAAKAIQENASSKSKPGLKRRDELPQSRANTAGDDKRKLTVMVENSVFQEGGSNKLCTCLN